jgi:hypothetical protein
VEKAHQSLDQVALWKLRLLTLLVAVDQCLCPLGHHLSHQVTWHCLLGAVSVVLRDPFLYLLAPVLLLLGLVYLSELASLLCQVAQVATCLCQAALAVLVAASTL